MTNRHEQTPTDMTPDTNRHERESSKPWFRKSAIGHNKLNSLMRKMAEKARLGPNVKYHSCCKQSTQFILETDHLSGMGLGKEL